MCSRWRMRSRAPSRADVPVRRISFTRVRSFRHVTPPFRVYYGADSLLRIPAEPNRLACRRPKRPLTLSEMMLPGHLDNPERQQLDPGESYLALRADRAVFRNVPGRRIIKN